MAAERERPTLADYVALAFSPALIMGLVGSLVFFLLQVLYAGEYEGRLRWILFFFVFGAVLIARVSMTAGISNRAGLYGACLGFVTWLGMQTFVKYPQESAGAELSWLINMGLIGVVWWCAHKLTWDCTHIEEESDVGGGGLLEEAGFEKGADTATSPPPAEEKELAPGLEAWWQRYQRYREGRGKKRALGVWVVYFSLAALPIFGLGQSLIPGEDGAARRYVFWLMTVYVGCGLGLLLMTCFLGLRRYLRQRKLSMPAAMTGVWLSVGGTLTVLLLLAGAFLPRPSAEYPLFDFSPVGAEKRSASDYAVKSDGRGEGKGKPGNVGDPKAESGNAQGKGGEPGGEGGQGKGGAGQGKDGSGKGEQSSSGGQSGSGQSQDKAGQGNDEGKEKGAGKGEQSRDGGDGSDKDKANAQGGDKKDEQAKGGQAAQKEKGSGGGRAEPKRSGGRGGSSRSSGGSSSTSALSSTVRGVANVLKWVVFTVLALVVIFFVLRGALGFLANFTGWARNLLAALQNFWASLFGERRPKKKTEEEEEAAEGPRGPPEKPFSSFSNPFENGSTRRMAAAELIRYTFAAVQAWARERDLGRQPGETALEFVERVSNEVPALEDALRPLVMLYGRAVYSRGSLPANAVEMVRGFWERLQTVVEQPLSA
jgi:hypothetical protein